MLKAEPTVLHDGRGAYRWITVHPNGKDERGIPVKIRESKAEPGTWHVVGGAGGKLNYLKLTNVKEPHEYAEQAKQRKETRKREEGEKRALEKQRLDSLTDEEREVERAKRDAEDAKKAKAAEHIEVQQQKFIADIAALAGWADSEWKFDATKADLLANGASADRVASLERQHAKQMLTKAREVVRETKRQFLLDHEARAAADLADLPLSSDDASTIALTDLDPDKASKGLGYQREVTAKSDAAIVGSLAAADVAKLTAELEAAQNDFDPNMPSTVGRVQRAQAELAVAETLRDGAGKTIEQLEAEAADLEERIKDAQAAFDPKDVKEARRLKRIESSRNAKGDSLDAGQEQALAEAQTRTGQSIEEVKALKERLDAVHVLLGAGDPAAKGERVELAKKWQEHRESEIRAEQGQEGVDAYRARRELLQTGLEEYRAEMASYKARGVLTPPKLETKAIADPKAAAEILRRDKALQQLQKDLDKKPSDIDERIFGKGYYVETRAAKLDAEIRRDITNRIAEARTRSFLEEVEKSDETSLLSLTEHEKRETMQRHVSTGAYNAINDASLTLLQQGVIPRDVADVLGAAATAQVLARVVHQSLDKGEVETIASALADYHLANHVEASEEAVRTAQSLYEQAREIEIGGASNPADLATMQELNRARNEKLLQAREILGRTLGELESTAALQLALRSSPAKEVHATLGPIGAESAIRQCRAIGLGRDDYQITFDGTNRFVTIKESGLDKIVTRIDPAEVQIANEVAAIKAGERDEDGWIPPGMTSRPATSFTDPNRTVESIGYHQRQSMPFNQWGDGEGRTLQQDVEEHIGARIADGEDPNDVLPDILRNLRHVPEQHRVGVVKALDQIMPTEVPLEEKGKPIWKTRWEKNAAGDWHDTGEVLRDEAGNRIQQTRRVKADHHAERLNQLAEAYVTKYFGSKPEVSAFHAQSIATDTPEAMDKTIEALHRSLAEDPRAAVAFKDPGELTPQDQAALRSYFSARFAKPPASDGADSRAKLEALGPEPEKESSGLFGKQTNPMWAEWDEKRRAIASETRQARTAVTWDQYAGAHKSARDAHAAMQDHLKHDFLQRFASAYASQHGKPLRLGASSIRNVERHVAAIDPAERQRLERDQRQMIDEQRARSASGQYAGGSVKEKVDRALQQAEIERQNAITLFDTPEATPSNTQRVSLGLRAENQLKALIATHGANLARHTDKPVKVFPDFSMSGGYVGQQRAVKMFLAAKRINAALGTGSGKTPISIGAFTAAASDPATGVKRGIWAVPSQVLGQFHGEIGQFIKPGAFNWHAVPGAAGAERMATHADPNTHMVITTHQSLRDDMVKLLASHWGVDNESATKRFVGLDRKARAAAMREAWQKAGIDYQASFVDEGHNLLDRRGKPDSLMSGVLQAVSDNTKYFMSMSADPAKNDISEIRSQLDKIHTDGRYSDEQAWHKRYGLATSASRGALRQEVASRFAIGHITPPITATRSEEAVTLHPEQQAEYRRIVDTYNKARADRSRGETNVEAIKLLSPSSFAGKPDTEHEAIAKRLADNLGILRESALNRAINLAPPEHNGKIQHLLKKLEAHPVKDKPVIVFAHNLDAVHHIEDALTKAGHRVTTLTGEHTGQEKDKRRTAFQPPKGREPEADIFVLSDAGATGLNLQRGQTLINYDTPMTAMVHAQRNGRIHRLGQTQDVDLVDLATDTEFEQRARQRMAAKYDLRSIFTDPGDAVDDTSLGGFISRARAAKRAGEQSPDNDDSGRIAA